ncbi:MAG: efflux RND transporter permease subunit, partial [Clostridia bacterium]|nr:efflux RND transporter permease subunit [Clostridia bacterium]
MCIRDRVGQSIQSQIKGMVATRYKYRGSEIDVMVCYADSSVKSLQDLKTLFIQSPRGKQVSLSELATVTTEKSPPSITRKDQKRTVSITANLEGIALNKATEAIDTAFKKYDFPPGYSYSYGGQQQDLYTSFKELFNALILSGLIVYMLLAAQFESLLHPLTMMLSVPLALTGGLISLLITGYTLSIPAFIGMIISVGIVVDNAIVLIDCVNRLRTEGMTREEAIIKAGPLRLRPILMTTLTTIIGMLPMAIAGKEGSEIQAPLAIVVIGGLSISTFVTLIVLPSVYITLENLIEGLKRRFDERMRA